MRCLAYIMKGSFSLNLWAIHYSRGPPKSFLFYITPKSNNHSIYYVGNIDLVLSQAWKFDRLDTISLLFLWVCVFVWLWHIWSRTQKTQKQDNVCLIKIRSKQGCLLLLCLLWFFWNRLKSSQLGTWTPWCNCILFTLRFM